MVEVLRCVLLWGRDQTKAARISAGDAAMLAKLGATIMASTIAFFDNHFALPTKLGCSDEFVMIMQRLLGIL